MLQGPFRWVVKGAHNNARWCIVSRSISTGSSNQQRQAYDPTARRPNRICDPYGQRGKPLSAAEAKTHQVTIHGDWKLVTTQTPSTHFGVEGNDQATDQRQQQQQPPPERLVREFLHADFLSGAKFLERIAAVALVNNHFPLLELDRVIVRKQWQVVSRISCRTKVLDGLSTNDFFLAMMIDVETNRPEMQGLFIHDSDTVERK